MDIQNVVGVVQAPQPESRGSIASRKPAPQVLVQQKSEPKLQQLQQAVQNINRTLQASRSTSLEFSVDQSTRRTVVKVVDKESGDLIRQIPSDAALAIAESIGEFQKGLLLKQEA
jgi:flagellar protein FlaG